jgi:Uma2 family endonuclease
MQKIEPVADGLRPVGTPTWLDPSSQLSTRDACSYCLFVVTAYWLYYSASCYKLRNKPVIAKSSRFYYTAEEYLRMEDNSAEKHEYYKGEIYLMAGGAPPHNLISSNLGSEINFGVRPKGCRTFTSDQLISNKDKQFFYYPDVSVVCGQLELLPGLNNVITNPILIVEVLSPSTARLDKGEKFSMYRTLPDLQSYIMVEPSEILVEHYRRLEKDIWLFEPLTDISQALVIPSLDLTIPLASIYYGVNFDE